MSVDPTGPGGQAGLPPIGGLGAPMVAVVAGDELVWTDQQFVDVTGLEPGSSSRDLLDVTAPWARAGLARRLGGEDGPRWIGRFGGRRSDGLPWVADLTASPSPVPSPWPGAVVLAGVRLGGPVGWTPAEPPRDASLGLDSMLSHDVRGALRHAGGFSGVVSRALAEAAGVADLPVGLAEAPARLETATRAVALADEMVEAAVRQLRVLAESWTVEPITVDQLTSRAGAAARARQAGAEANVHAAGGGVVLVAAAGRLGEALAELVVNATRFGGPQVQVTVTATPVEDGWARVVVTDDGPGVAADLVEDAFLPGRMLQPRGRFPGVGMGLAFVRAVVARHGGRAAMEPGGGTEAAVAPAGGGTAVALELPAQPPSTAR